MVRNAPSQQPCCAQYDELELMNMKKTKKSAAIQIIGGIVLLALLAGKQILSLGPPMPLYISAVIIFVSIASIYTGIYQLKK